MRVTAFIEGDTTIRVDSIAVDEQITPNRTALVVDFYTPNGRGSDSISIHMSPSKLVELVGKMAALTGTLIPEDEVVEYVATHYDAMEVFPK